MENEFHPEKVVIWIIGQGSMLNNLLRRRLMEERGLSCRLAASFEEMPLNQLCPTDLWLALFDAQNMDQAALEALIQTCDSRFNCVKALFNVHVKDQLALEQQAFKYGWQGIFSVNIGLEKMVGGITDLMEGRLWVQRNALPKNKVQLQALGLSSAACLAKLTKRERQVLRVITKGATNEEISAHMDIGLHTVKKHIYNIYQKIKVPNRIQAAIWGIENLTHS